MAVLVEKQELDDLTDLMQRRADEMIRICVEEGKTRAASYAAAGRQHPQSRSGRRHYTARRRVMRVHRATPAQEARMINNSVYQHVFGFFNNW